MKLLNIVFTLALLFPCNVFANKVYLDCVIQVDDTPTAKSDYLPNGGDRITYEIDIDLEKQQAIVGGWSTNTYILDPNDPQFTLGLTNKEVRFGDIGVDGLWMSINRENLSVSWVLKFLTQFYGAMGKGKCVKVESRKRPSGF